MKIALFGTSADPPTVGHQNILEWLSNHFDRVVVWASNNPFKSHNAELEQRMKMLEIAISHLKNAQKNVELREEISSPRSLEVVNAAEQIWGKNVDYHLVVGSDILGQIPSWYSSQELLQKTKLLVVPRPSYKVKEAELEKIETMGGECVVADFVAPAVSSTAYREKCDSDIVSQPVEDYICQKQLYKCQNRR